MNPKKERTEYLDELRRNPQGLAWCSAHTDFVDAAILEAYRTEVGEHPVLADVGLAATGGYGRRELSPWSDVDLVVIPEQKQLAHTSPAVKSLFRALVGAVEALGLRIGYQMVTENDVAGLDSTSISTLMDARPLAGSGVRWQGLHDQLLASIPVAEFVLKKLDERKAQESKTHGTPYFVRPDLKEGAGGLRSFQAAQWIRIALGQRKAPIPVAYDFLVRVRNLLHMEAGRCMDVMDDSRRASVADRLGVSSAELGSQVAGAMSVLAEHFEKTVEELRYAGFELAHGVEAHRGAVRFDREATLGSAAVGVALAVRLGIGVPRIKAALRPTVSGREVMRSLDGGAPVLRAWDRCGLLQELLPELTACRTLYPGDASHSFTVFEHTLRVVENLDNVPGVGFLANVASEVSDRRPLVVAALLHDVGKLYPNEPHSLVGERIAIEVCERLDLLPETSELVSWLVREHLSMSEVVRTRDVARPETVQSFADLVKTPLRLANLSLLTWADVSAVGEGIWTPVQENFVLDLYRRTLDLVQGERTQALSVQDARARLASRVGTTDAPEEEIVRFVDSMPAQYVVSTSAAQARQDFEMVLAAAEGSPVIECVHFHDVQVSQVTVAAQDEPGHLSRILGVFYAFDVSLHDIRAATKDGDPKILLDRFTLSFGGRPVPSATVHQLRAALTEVLGGAVQVEDLLRSRGKDPSVREPILRYTFTEGDPAILELRTQRGRGMPYRLSRLIAERGWNILTARIGQWAGLGTASFYLNGVGGARLERIEVARDIEEAMVSSAAR
ncbi:MAG: HD domain-containing protein [Fimbriimonadaceae bacterium]|nr:HD domain-containing protein [Fimbriimonadaceae bacterium]